jgi:glutathionyl-hydroquinone reductase
MVWVSTLIEVDWRLLTTLIRFDAFYHRHFKYNLGGLPVSESLELTA